LWLLVGLSAVLAAFGLGVLLSEPEAESQETASSGSVAELALLDQAVDGSGLERVVDTGGDEVVAALVLAHELVTADGEGAVQVWGRSDGSLLGEARSEIPLAALAEAESSRFLAAVDRWGGVGLVDVADPERPRIVAFGVGLSAGERPMAIAFSDESDEIVTVGSGGEVLRVDVITGGIASRSSLRDFRGDLPWGRDVNLTLVAAKFVPEVYDDDEGLLVATAGGEVADLDLAKGRGETIIRAGVVPGRVLSLDRVPYGEVLLAVGATGGMVVLDEESYEDLPETIRGPTVPAVAIQDEQLLRGDREGLTFGQYSSRPPSGPSVRRFEVSFHGTAAIHPEGRVSVLGPPAVGISMAETESTPVTAFDRQGRLLVAEGYDANHVEKIEAIRIQPRDPNAEFQEDEVVQSYRPDRDWWPTAQDPEALYLNDVATDGEYVFGAGQDPEGRPAVLVWDAESGEPLHHLTLGAGGLPGELPSVVTELMVLPGKQKIAAYSVAQELISIWSTESWELIDSIPVGPVGDMSVSPDESTIVAVGLGPGVGEYLTPDDPTPLILIDVDEGRVEDEIASKGVVSAAFSPDGSVLAMVDENGLMLLRSADGREPSGPLVDLGGIAEALAWRPDGKLIAVARAWGGLVLVDPESGEVSRPLPSDWEADTSKLTWNPEGTLLAALNPVEESDGIEPGPVSIWRLGAAALERRMCELSSCQSAVDSAESGLGDASHLASVDYVFQEGGYLLGGELNGEQARIGYAGGELAIPIAYDWSEDGLAWVSDGQVNVLLAGERRPRSWPCPCSGVAWVGDEVLSLERDGQRLIWIDPQQTELRTTPTRGVPPHLPSLLGIVSGEPVVAAFESEPDRATPSALFALGPSGSARRLTADAHGSIYLRSPSSSPDSLGFLASLSGGVCFSTVNAGVVSADRAGEIALSFPPSPFGDEPTWIRSLQVAADGTVSAAIAPIGCDKNGYPENEVPLAEHYLLEDGRWRPTGEEGYDVQRAGGATLVAESEGPTDPGPLLIETGNGREEIAPRAEGLAGNP
jgi:hypothetical protein